MSCARSDGTSTDGDDDGLAGPDGDGLVEPGGAVPVGPVPVPVEPELDDPGGAPTRLAIAAEYVLWKPMLLPKETSTFCSSG
jgi:hypothetical protein